MVRIVLTFHEFYVCYVLFCKKVTVYIGPNAGHTPAPYRSNIDGLTDVTFQRIFLYFLDISLRCFPSIVEHAVDKHVERIHISINLETTNYSAVHARQKKLCIYNSL